MADKPLDQCYNGCDAPPHPPSYVLCKDCLAALDKKMHDLLGPKRDGGNKKTT